MQKAEERKQKESARERLLRSASLLCASGTHAGKPYRSRYERKRGRLHREQKRLEKALPNAGKARRKAIKRRLFRLEKERKKREKKEAKRSRKAGRKLFKALTKPLMLLLLPLSMVILLSALLSTVLFSALVMLQTEMEEQYDRTQSEECQYIYDFLMREMGLPLPQTCVVMADMSEQTTGESGSIDHLSGIGGQGATGLRGWNAGPLVKAEEWLLQNGYADEEDRALWTDLTAQLRLYQAEFDLLLPDDSNGWKSAGSNRAFMKAESLEEAAAVYADGFGLPGCETDAERILETAEVFYAAYEAVYTAAALSREARLRNLFPDGLPKTQEEAESYLTVITVSALNGAGEEYHLELTVHKRLAGRVKRCFYDMESIGFRIKESSYAYSWRKMQTAGNTDKMSYHSYGTAIDIIPADGTRSIPQEVVDIWKKYGFYWGGDWKCFDTVHFTWTNN